MKSVCEKQQFVLALMAIVVLSGFSTSCGETGKPNKAATNLPPDYKEPPPPTKVEIASTPYPRATWRLTETPRASMVIAASHIVISFKDAKLTNPWSLFVTRASDRTIEDAAELALDLTRQLFEAPGRFDELAAKWSDDLTTAPVGGRLGVFRGDQVSEEVLDALCVIPITQVAQLVVRTDFGFHIFRRDPLPSAGQVSLARILLSHAGSMDALEYRHKSSRSLAEARELAKSLAQRVAEDPAKFTALVREHSDGIEALRDGDLGEFEQYGEIVYPVRRTVARELEAGQLPAVVETGLGVEILVRTHIERPTLAASQILIGDLTTPKALLGRPADRTREEAKTLASRVATLAKGKESFESIAKQYCDGPTCIGFQWQAGHADPRIESALMRVREGAVTKPIETPIGYVVLRREAPKPTESVGSPRDTKPSESLYLGIPKPPITGPKDYVTLMDGKALAFHARQVAQYVKESMAEQLTDTEKAAVVAGYEKLATDWESRAGQWSKGRLEAWQAWRTQLIASVGAEKSQAVLRKSSEWLTRAAPSK